MHSTDGHLKKMHFLKTPVESYFILTTYNIFMESLVKNRELNINCILGGFLKPDLKPCHKTAHTSCPALAK